MLEIIQHGAYSRSWATPISLTVVVAHALKYIMEWMVVIVQTAGLLTLLESR